MIDLDCEIHSKQQISRPPSGGLGQVDQSQHSNKDAPITVTYNKDNQVIAEKNSKTGDKIKYVYDDNGNLIEKKTKGKSTVYSYDTENRLRSVTKGGKSLLAATYDGDGNKVFQMSRKTKRQEKTSENCDDTGRRRRLRRGRLG